MEIVQIQLAYGNKRPKNTQQLILLVGIFSL